MLIIEIFGRAELSHYLAGDGDKTGEQSSPLRLTQETYAQHLIRVVGTELAPVRLVLMKLCIGFADSGLPQGQVHTVVRCQ